MPFRTHVEVVGSEGTVTIPRPYKPGTKETILLTRGDAAQSIEVKGPELYLGEVEDLHDAIRQGRPSRVSLEDSRGNVATLVALLRSARQGAPVTVTR